MSAHVTRRIRRGLRFEALDLESGSLQEVLSKLTPPARSNFEDHPRFQFFAAPICFALAVLVFLLTGCGGAVDPAPCPDAPPAATAADAGACNQTKALDLWREEHGEDNAVGDWQVSKDCYVCEILGPFGGECGYVYPN